jgi:hypothetical protein
MHQRLRITAVFHAILDGRETGASLVFAASLNKALYKKFPAKAGRVRGIVCARDVLVQSGPANELYRAAPQVKILGQYGLYVLGLSGLIHCFAELNDAAKLVAAAILRVGQDKLRVVLSGHGFRLRPAS